MRLAWLLWAVTLSAAFASAETPFVGAEHCRLCHRQIYASWEQTPHANPPPAGADAEGCRDCHETERGEGRLDAVQCEACHGPGADYSAPEVMIDPDKAASAGLVRPTEKVCQRCHVGGPSDHTGELLMPTGEEWPAAIHQRRAP